MYKVPNHKVSAEVIYETATCLSLNGNKDIISLSSFAGISHSYMSSSLLTLQMLNISNSEYILTKDVKKLLEKYPTKLHANDFLKEILMRWDPFVMFLSYLSKGYSYKQAIEKVNYTYPFDKKDFALELFTKWIKDLNISIENIETDLSSQTEYILKQYSQKVYLCNILPEDVYKFIDEDVKNNLSCAIENFLTPEKSISDTGKAVEDFLRLIDKDKNSQPSSTNGIGQISNELRGKNIIHQKLNKICEALGDIRNMAGHGKEKISLVPWKLTVNAAISYFHIAISSIISIYNYVYNNIQLF